MAPLQFFRDPPLLRSSACVVEDLSEKLADISFQFEVQRDLSLLSWEPRENNRSSEKWKGLCYMRILLCDTRNINVKFLRCDGVEFDKIIWRLNEKNNRTF